MLVFRQPLSLTAALMLSIISRAEAQQSQPESDISPGAISQMGALPQENAAGVPAAKTIGLYNPATSLFYLRNSNTTGIADLTFGYGPPGAGWKPLAGDWNGPGS